MSQFYKKYQQTGTLHYILFLYASYPSIASRLQIHPSLPNLPLKGRTLSFAPWQWDCCCTLTVEGAGGTRQRKGPLQGQVRYCVSSSYCCAAPVTVGTNSSQWCWAQLWARSNNPSVHSGPQPGDHLAMVLPTRTHAPSCQQASSRCQDSTVCPPISLRLPSAQRVVSCSSALVVAPHWLASVHLQPKSSVFCGPALAREPNKLLCHQLGYGEVHTFSSEVWFPVGELCVSYNKRSSIK